MIENKISEALAIIGSEMEYTLGTEGKREARTLAEEYMVRNMPQSIDKLAMQDPYMNHLYELRHRGQARYRLFKMIRREGNVSVVLRPAKMLVPLSDLQKEPGPKGRRVTKRYRFPARPWVYEYGKKVTIKRRGSKRMWTVKTKIVRGAEFFPPLVGPVTYVPKPQYRFKLRESVRIYLASDGRMHMNAAASKYARHAKRTVVASLRGKVV